jgi:hypothetical protein
MRMGMCHRRGAERVLLGKPDKNISHGRPGCIREEILKLVFKKSDGEHGLHFCGT